MLHRKCPYMAKAAPVNFLRSAENLATVNVIPFPEMSLGPSARCSSCHNSAHEAERLPRPESDH